MKEKKKSSNIPSRENLSNRGLPHHKRVKLRQKLPLRAILFSNKDTADRRTEEEQDRAEERPTESVERDIPSRDVGFRFSRKSALKDKHIPDEDWEDAYWASDE